MANISITINTPSVNVTFHAGDTKRSSFESIGLPSGLLAALFGHMGSDSDQGTQDTGDAHSSGAQFDAPTAPTAPDTPYTPDTATPTRVPVAGNVMTYDKLLAGHVTAGDYVHWSGTKWQFEGVVIGNPTQGFDDGTPCVTVRVQRDDTGATVKLNITADATGTLALL